MIFCLSNVRFKVLYFHNFSGLRASHQTPLQSPRGDALAAGKRCEIAQEVSGKIAAAALIGIRGRHYRSSHHYGLTATFSDCEKAMPAFFQRHTRQLPGGKGAGVDIDPVR